MSPPYHEQFPGNHFSFLIKKLYPYLNYLTAASISAQLYGIILRMNQTHSVTLNWLSY